MLIETRISLRASIETVRAALTFDGVLAPAILAEHGDTIRTNFERSNQALKAHAEGHAR